MKRKFLSLCCVLLLLTGCAPSVGSHNTPSSLPAYQDAPYTVVADNRPDFSEEELACSTPFEEYSPLDALGRCGPAFACVGRELMPTEQRGSIGQIKPSGWQTVKYEQIDGKYLYNRCHLIGYQLTGENANEENLITGTRYLNTQGMLPFENMVADYIKETGNHVLYRVTPVFEGDNLVAGGVTMEGYSLEDQGEGICFYVYCYNIQPGIVIDYATGESRLDDPSVSSAAGGSQTLSSPADPAPSYILNTNTRKFHTADCSQVSSIKESNREVYYGERSSLLAQGYSPCKNCNP